MAETMTERQMANALTEFLTRKPSYNGYAPIESYIQSEIQKLARDIATEVVANMPELSDVIRERTKSVIAQALRDDSYLNRTITGAIAKVLTENALGSEE